MIGHSQVDRADFLDPPRSCGTELEREPWVGSFAVRVRTSRYVGVRSNSAPLLDLLATMLGSQVAPGLAVHKNYYSVKVGTPGRRTRTPLHYLYAGGRVVVGTRDLRRLVLALGQHVRDHEDQERPEYLVDAVPVIGPRGAVLAPSALRGATAAVDQMLVHRGAALYDAPHALLDGEAVSVIVPPPPYALPAPEALSAVGPSLREPVPEPGSYAFAGWVMQSDEENVGLLRPALSAYRSVALLSRPFPRGPRLALEDMATLAQRSSMHAAHWHTPEELVALVAAKVL